jgi:hypothetical protein
VETNYTDFMATHPLMFAKATDPQEADNWLCIIVFKFGLLHYTGFQKTVRGPAALWTHECLVV